MSARTTQKPAFFWQGLLILLPVGVMAAIGLGAILRDRATVEQQARQRAQEMAQELAPELGRRVAGELAGFEVIGLSWFEDQRLRLERLQRGTLMVAARRIRPSTGPRMAEAYPTSAPRPLTSSPTGSSQGPEGYPSAFAKWQAAYPDLRAEAVFPSRVWWSGNQSGPGTLEADEPPRPPFWLRALSEEQRRAWDALGQVRRSSGKLAELAAAVERLFALAPPPEARVNGELLLLELGRQGAGSEAVEALLEFAEGHREVAAESGVPLSNLAIADALRASGGEASLGIALDALVDESLLAPSFLLPGLLEEARSLIRRLAQPREVLERAEALWSAQARLGGIARAIRQSGRFGDETNLWMDAAGGRWFCTLQGRQLDRLPSAALHPGPRASGWGEGEEPAAAAVVHPVNRAVDAGYSATNHLFIQGSAVEQTNQLMELCVYPEVVVERAFAKAIREAGRAVPRYFRLKVELEGQPLNRDAAARLHPETGRVLAEIRDRLGPRVVAPAEELLTVQRSRLVGEIDASGREANEPGRSGADRNVRAPETNAIGPGANASEDALPTKTAELVAPPGRPQFTLQVRLADAAGLFAEQRQRSLLYGGLIVASTLAALVGLVAARRAFSHQLRLSELKSNFVSSVSHELRAPIASVRLMAESLERGKAAGAAKQQEYYRFIGQECRRLSALIENVLDFARIEQGRKRYEFEPTNLVALAQETVRLMETYAAERQVKLLLSIDEAQLEALSTQPVVDGKALQQALVNLIDNGTKHSPRDQPVTIGLEMLGREEPRPAASDAWRRASSGQVPFRVALWVEDHGEGIPMEEHAKIFERFYRRGSELRRETPGVGIGLSIVKHIVEAHGGRVLVRSAVGQGSRFTMELPLRQAAENSENRNRRPA